MKNPTPKSFQPVVSRVADLMAHTSRYQFHGHSRLAEDAGIGSRSLSRLINESCNPSFVLVCRVTAALEKSLNRRIDPRDVVAEFGNFLTRNVCEVAGCPGCLPEAALNEFGQRTFAYKDVEKGRWVCSKYPHGVTMEGGDNA